jgi:hypothetical protein
MKFFQATKGISEANIQAELYHQCKLRGIKIYLEYRHEGCVFDAVIVRDFEIVAIVECKSYNSSDVPNLTTKQYARYSSFGVPLFYIVNFKQVVPTLDQIQSSILS